MIIVIDDMRAAGKNGYIAKIIEEKRQFLHPCERTGYGASKNKLTFDLTEDGIYEVCDANFGGRKRNIYFLKIENGIEIERTDTLAELLTSSEEFPAFEGSQKQCSWADSIRMKFVAKLKQSGKEIPSWVREKKQASFWIDNRSKLS